MSLCWLLTEPYLEGSPVTKEATVELAETFRGDPELPDAFMTPTGSN